MKHLFSKLLLYAVVFCTTFQNVYSSDIGPLRALECPELCHTRDFLKETLIEEISSAKKSLLFFAFTFSDRDLISLINDKAEEGIEVIIIIDNDHESPFLKYGSEKLKIVTRPGQGRVHHKILSVDDENVWLGSANFTSSAYNTQENLFIGVKSITFAKALREESEIFQGKKQRSNTTTFQEKYGEELVSLYLLPYSNPYRKSLEAKMNSEAKQELISLIAKAKSHIRIAMMVWTEPELEKAIIQAHKRGVFVEILLSDKKNTLAKNLENAGVLVKVNPNLNFLHNKMLLIDESTLVNGSANWSKSAFSRNDESFFVIKNLKKEHIAYLKDYWVKLLE
jgi:cardiolipin synthase